MALELKTQIEIDAPADRVWRVLTDFAAYPRWNPFILELHGVVHEGATIRFRFEFLRGVRIWTEALVLTVDQPRELCWVAHFLSPRLFNGKHSFTIEPMGESKVVFHHLETFSGISLPIMRPVLESHGPAIYQGLNSALKKQVETSGA